MDPFIGEIRMFGGSFAPSGWALCNGQLLPISANQALFAILGTTYGGNGTTNFQLPDFRSRVPIHAGQGLGLSPYIPGQIGGVEQVQLTINNLPSHTHLATFTGTGGGGGSGPLAVTVKVPVASALGTTPDPNGSIPAESKAGVAQLNAYAATSAATGSLGGVTATVTGGGGITGGTVTNAVTGSSLPAATLPPYLCVNFIIALNGVFPSRN